MKNACIVGYGAIGPVHANAVDRAPDACLYAVCDVDAARAQKCVDNYGCRYYPDFDEMLKDGNIDVVHICTPHWLHKDMAIAALSAGKHVVLEKPAAMNRDEFRELSEFCGKSEAKLCVMLQNRTNACICKMMDFLKNDASAGKLEGVLANLAWHRDEKYYAHDEWRGKWDTEGGGLLINQAVHLIDLMIYFGGRVCDVKSNISHWKIKNIEVEDTANALIKFESGIYGVFSATNCHSCDSPFYLELQFEKAKLRYADSVLYKISDSDIEIIERDKKANVGKEYWGSGHERVINSFYSALNGKGGAYTDIHGAAESMNVVYSMYEKGMAD